MVYQKTEWKDQNVESPRTYSVRQNLDGTITLLDAFGEITEVGTPVNAENMNKIENGIVQNESDISKRKLIAYDADRNPGSLSGSYTLVLQDNDERVSLQVNDNITITIDISQLTFPKEWYTIVIEIYFPNGAKTVNLSYAGGIRWINGLTPDFTNGRTHLLALTKHRVWGDIVMSDAGTLGG